MQAPTFTAAAPLKPASRPTTGLIPRGKTVPVRIARRRIGAPVAVMLWIRHGDGRRFTAAAAFLITILLGLFFISSIMHATDPVAAGIKAKAAQAQAAAETHRKAQARRVGSIIFESNDRLCDELKFDNFTGETLAVGKVDCEARLAPAAPADPTAAKKNGMRSMLESFSR
jgi:hypothetical protein